MSDPLRQQGGFADLVGYALTDWREDYAELSLTVEEKHLNRSGVLHGGVLTTLIDTVCGYAGIYCAEPGQTRRAFTLSLNTQFIGSVELGSRLTAIGCRSGGGQRIFFSSAEIRDQDGRLVGRGDAVYRYRSS